MGAVSADPSTSLGMTAGGVIPSERSEPSVIPSERSESRDLHVVVNCVGLIGQSDDSDPKYSADPKYSDPKYGWGRVRG